MMSAVHVIAASLALIVGLVVIFTGKGSGRHRLLGRVYLVLMLFVNGAALTIYGSGGFGIFHGLALVSLATIGAGFAAVRFRQRFANWRMTHAQMMSWSFVGLAAAATCQLGTSLFNEPGWPIIVTFVVGGILVQFGVARALASGRA